VTRFRAILLAGSRGEGDPLARDQGVRHRALLEVGGVPMLLRVFRTLRALASVERVLVSIDEPAALDDQPELAAARAEGTLEVRRSLDSPSRSVLDALEHLGEGGPVLVTTADHALLTPEIAEHFLRAADASDADLLVGLVARSLLEARFPESTRTYIPFRGEHFSGANLFAFRTPEARRAAAFWVRAESLRKRPWRLVAAFGPGALLLFALRRLDLDAALHRASEIMGARVAAVRLPFAEAAIDVDRPSDLELVNRILAEAQSQRSSSAPKQPRAGS
jgi:GTP:adenosylcobinamide-phosphate guanylyltransferase